MSNSSDPVELVLAESAKKAVERIACLLGNRAEEEAVYRSLGTELYLLQRVSEGDKLYLQSPQGVMVEVDLL
jgi:hypothetical protein